MDGINYFITFYFSKILKIQRCYGNY